MPGISIVNSVITIIERSFRTSERFAIVVAMTLLAVSCSPPGDLGTNRMPNVADLDGEKVELTAKCTVSKVPSTIKVFVGEKGLFAELPKEFAGRFPSGDRAWVGLTGIIHLQPQGGPMTAEQSDGHIEVEAIHFYDQKSGHSESLVLVE